MSVDIFNYTVLCIEILLIVEGFINITLAALRSVRDDSK